MPAPPPQAPELRVPEHCSADQRCKTSNASNTLEVEWNPLIPENSSIWSVAPDLIESALRPMPVVQSGLLRHP